MDEYGNDDEYHSYGSSDEYNEGDLDGFQLVGEGNQQGSDPADDWLASVEDSNGPDPESLPEGYMGATAADLQLGRIGHVEPRVQAGIKAILSGQNINGISALDAAAAREQFAEEISGDPAKFAKQLKIDGAVEVPKSSQDLKQVLSMLQNTSGEYLERGPGKTLPGNFFDEEKLGKADEDFNTAMQYIDELSDLYIHKETKGSSIYGTRKEAVKTKLTERLMDSVLYSGSSAIVPTPNELDIAGLLPTMSYRGSQGTKFNRISFEAEAQSRGWTDQDVAFWEHKPSVKNSLFPKPRRKSNESYDGDKVKRDQDYQFEQARFKAQFARDVLRKEMPTNRDESAGQIRMAGFDTPYGDQADRMSAMNESSIQGLDFMQEADTEQLRADDGIASSGMTADQVAAHGEGSARGGMYGDKALSEVDLFIEQAMEAEDAPEDDIEGIKQLTPEWHEARKGIITASRLTTSGGRRLNPKEMAADLARDKMGLGSDFIGNSYTADGNKGEPIALAAFLGKMNREGSPLQHTEVGLLTDASMPGMGASPDGRLKNEDGSSAGLLELKYLTTGSMKGALKKYNTQMQLQMAVTGEKETHFFALDKYTGDSLHKLVKADPEYQVDLIDDINKAQLLAGGLDARGVQQLDIESANQRKGDEPRDTTGQTESVTISSGTSSPMTSYKPGRDISGGDAPSASMQAAILKAAAVGGSSTQQAGDHMAALFQVDQERTKQRAKERFQTNQGPTFGSSDNSEAMGEMADHYKKAGKAAEESAKGLKELSRSAGKALGALSEIANFAMSGNQTAMDTMRFASESGMTSEAARGLEFALQSGEGGLTQKGARSVMAQAGTLQRKFNDVTQIESTYTGLATKFAGAGLPGLGLELPSIAEFRDMDPQQTVAAVASMMEGRSAEERAQIGSVFGMNELAMSNISGTDLASAKGFIDEEGNRSFTTGEQGARQTLQKAQETAAAGSGAVGGASSVVLEKAAALQRTNIGSGVANLLTGAGVMGAGAVIAKKGAGVVSVAKSALSVVGKINPILAAATLAPTIMRYATDTEDDGGAADSALDIMEMASYGAGIGGLVGSVVPGLGTVAVGAVGGAIGAGIGAVNEAYEYFSGDDVVPSDAIIKPDSVTPNQNTASPELTNNIELNVSVDPSMVRTDAEINGEEYELGAGHA